MRERHNLIFGMSGATYRQKRFRLKMIEKYEGGLGNGCSDDEESNLDTFISNSVCSVCGYMYEICQSPPVDMMGCYDERQSPTRLAMVRDGVIGDDDMTDAQKHSFDIHYR